MKIAIKIPRTKIKLATPVNVQLSGPGNAYAANSENTTISESVVVPPGSNTPVPVPDTDISIVNSEDTQIAEYSVPSGIPSALPAPDSRVFNTEGLEQIHSLPAAAKLKLNPAKILFKDSQDNTQEISAPILRATEDHYDLDMPIIPNFTVFESDGVTVKVKKDIDNPNYTMPAPDPCPVPFAATPMKTGYTTSVVAGDDGQTQRGISRSVLRSNNPKGNTNRFTDIDGGQDFAAKGNLLVDWMSYDDATGDVNLWCTLEQPSQTAASHITAAAALSITVGAKTFAGFNLANHRELQMLQGAIWDGSLNQDGSFNYPPFNIVISGNAGYLHTSSIRYAGSNVVVGNAYQVQLQSDANGRRALYTKRVNISTLS